MRANSHGLKSSCGARRSSGGGETSAHSVAKPPAGGRGGASSVRPLLPVGVRRCGVAEAVSAESRSTAKWSPSATIMLFRLLTREFSVMVGLMSGKAKSAVPQNSVGSRSRGRVGRLVCGWCHKLGDHAGGGARFEPATSRLQSQIGQDRYLRSE